MWGGYWGQYFVCCISFVIIFFYQFYIVYQKKTLLLPGGTQKGRVGGGLGVVYKGNCGWLWNKGCTVWGFKEFLFLYIIFGGVERRSSEGKFMMRGIWDYAGIGEFLCWWDGGQRGCRGGKRVVVLGNLMAGGGDCWGYRG